SDPAHRANPRALPSVPGRAGARLRRDRDPAHLVLRRRRAAVLTIVTFERAARARHSGDGWSVGGQRGHRGASPNATAAPTTASAILRFSAGRVPAVSFIPSDLCHAPSKAVAPHAVRSAAM